MSGRQRRQRQAARVELRAERKGSRPPDGQEEYDDGDERGRGAAHGRTGNHWMHDTTSAAEAGRSA